MLKVGDELICKTQGQPETEYCIRGVVRDVKEGNVTISRALKFGTLKMSDLTLPEAELLKYYTPMENDQDADTDPQTGAVYEVTVCRTGVVFVKAGSEEDAMTLADHLAADRISWSDDWHPSDAMRNDDPNGEVFDRPDFGETIDRDAAIQHDLIVRTEPERGGKNDG